MVGLNKEQNRDYYHFFPPVEGIVSRSFDEKSGHFGTDVVAKANSKVSTIADGVIIFTDWTIKPVMSYKSSTKIIWYRYTNTIPLC